MATLGVARLDGLFSYYYYYYYRSTASTAYAAKRTTGSRHLSE